jgi:DnaJ-class molecular chaperone
MEMEQRDYYQTLGIDKEASQQQIKEAYRKLAFQYHPDRNRGDSAAAERMKDVNEAYAVLSDPRKRGEYDVLKERLGPSAYGQFRRSYSEQDIFRGSDVDQVFEEMGKAFGFRGFDEIFREFYGQGYRTFEFRSAGGSSRGFVFSTHLGREGSSWAQQVLGRRSGKFLRYILKRMTGIEWPEQGRDWHDRITLDPFQARTGGEIRYFHRRRARDLMVKIPAGLKEGQHIRLRGMGADGKGGGEPGDLYLKVRYRRPVIQKIIDFLGRLRFRF